MTGEQRPKIGVTLVASGRGRSGLLARRRVFGAIMTSAIALTAFDSVAVAQTIRNAEPRPLVDPGSEIPMTPWGKPDLTGGWTNNSLTELERESRYGDRIVMTQEELREVEGEREEAKAVERQPSDLSDPDGGCDIPGVSGVVCAYNSFWTDPGDTVMRVGGEPRTSFITTPPDGMVPDTIDGVQMSLIKNGLEEETVARRDGGARSGKRLPVEPLPGAGPADDPEIRSVSDRCLLSFGYSTGPVMLPPRYNSNYFFILTEDTLAIEAEMVHDVRQIRIGGEHRTDGIPRWMGDSIGWWEGDTLVAETINYHPYETIYGSDENLKVTERFTRVALDRILYQFQVEDPTVWAEPWGGEYEFALSDGKVYEYACHEGNYAMPNILAGARADDAAGGPKRLANAETSE